MKTVRRITYKHWFYTDITTSKPDIIDGLISKVDTSLKELYKNQANIEMAPAGAPEELHMGFALREPNPDAPDDRSRDTIYLNHKAHGWDFAEDNDRGLAFEVMNTHGGKANDVNFLWTPDIEFSPQAMTIGRIGGSTLNPDIGFNVSLVEVTADSDLNLLRSAHEMCHILMGRIHLGTNHTVQGKFRYLMEALPVALRMRFFEIDAANPSGGQFAS